MLTALLNSPTCSWPGPATACRLVLFVHSPESKLQTFSPCTGTVSSATAATVYSEQIGYLPQEANDRTCKSTIDSSRSDLYVGSKGGSLGVMKQIKKDGFVAVPAADAARVG